MTKPKIKHNELSDETVLLLQVLASTDVLFSPMLIPHREHNSNCCEIFGRRQSFLRGEGLVWHVGGSAEHRKGGERLLSTLKSAGFLTLPRRRGSHRHVALTPRGDDIGRRLIGHPTAADAWRLLQAIVEAVADRRGVGPDGPGIWLLEKQLIVGDEGDVAAVRELVLPLLVRGFVRQGCDVDGLLLYTATDVGKQASQGPPPEPEDGDIESMPEAAELYQDAYATARQDRDGWRAASGHVFIPFPAQGEP